MFYQFVSPILSTKFSQFEQLKKKEKILLVQNIFKKFRIPNIRIFLFQLTNWALSYVNSQSKYKHISYYVHTRLISSRVTKMHMTQTGTYLLVVLYFKGEEDMNHSQTVTSVCNVFSLDYTFFPTRRLVCYVSHYGAFFHGYC